MRWIIAVYCRTCKAFGPRRDVCVFCESTNVIRCQIGESVNG